MKFQIVKILHKPYATNAKTIKKCLIKSAARIELKNLNNKKIT